MTDSPEPAGIGLEARFPDPIDRTPASGPDHGSRRPHRLPVAGFATALLVGVATVVLGWFRLPAVARDTLWAEDSRLFLQQRIVLGPWATLFHPYDGYQHLVPRVLTDVAVAVAPIEQYAHAVTLLALAAVGTAAAATYAFSGGLVRTRTARIGLALVPVLLPISATEALGNFANLHWFALFLAPFLLLHRPATRTRAAFQTVVMVFVAMTEIQTVVFVPLLVLTARRRRAWPVAVAYLLGLTVQFTTYFLQPRVRTDAPPFVFTDAVRGFFAEPSLSVWVHDGPRAAALLQAHGVVLLAVAFAPFVAALVVAVAARWGRRSLLAVVLACWAVGVWFVDIVVNPNELVAFGAQGWGILATFGFVRYALVPSMFLVAVVLVAADRLLSVGASTSERTGTAGTPDGGTGGADTATRPSGAVRRVVAVASRSVGVLVLGGLVAVLVSAYHPTSTARSGGPDWQTSVRTAEQSCASAPATARQRIEGAPAGWGVRLSCVDVDGDARFP